MDACTIISSNYLPYARTMVRSYRRYHPEGRFFVLLLDTPADYDPSEESWETVIPEELGMGEELDSMRMMYDAYEMSMSLRPALLLYLMRKKNAERIAIMDSDLYFTGRLEGTDELFTKHAISICVSIRSPIPEDGKRPQDDDFILAGSLNGGFVLCRRCEESEKTMDWLDRKLRKHGFYRPYEGYFGDQKWLDLLPSFCETLGILKRPDWNASYWNMHERTLTEKDGAYFIEGHPMAFFHFSGFRPNDIEAVSVHQNRYQMKDLPALRPLAEEYVQRLKEEGYDEWIRKGYGFNRFTNGVTISTVVRRAYEELQGPTRFKKPHDTKDGDFFRWIQYPIKDDSPVSNLHMSIWRMSLEARGRFPEPMGKNFDGFANWILKERHRELSLDPVFTKSLKNAHVGRRPLRVWASNMLRLRHIFPPYQLLCRVVKRVIGRKLYDKIKPRRKREFGYEYFRLTRTDRRPAGVTLLSSVGGRNGVSEASRGLFEAIRFAGIATEHLDSKTAPGRQDLIKPTRRRMWYDTTIVSGGTEEIADIVNANEFVIGPNQRLIANVPWESQLINSEIASGLNAFDEVWTPSQFSAECLRAHLTTPVAVVPCAIDVSHPAPEMRKAFDIPADAFFCLFVFDFHSHMSRKNPAAAIRAFREAYGDDPSAILLIVGTHGDDFPAEKAELMRAVSGSANIRYSSAYLPRAELLGLLASCDCYVSLHRSEGFGMTVAEAMALGVPTVATDFGGVRDFLSEKTGWPVRHTPYILDHDEGPYARGAQWAEADIHHAAACMKTIRSNTASVRKTATEGQRFVQEHLSIEAVGAIVAKTLKR